MHSTTTPTEDIMQTPTTIESLRADCVLLTEREYRLRDIAIREESTPQQIAAWLQAHTIVKAARSELLAASLEAWS